MPMAYRAFNRCPLLHALLDLRGRCNRGWMALVAIVLINIEVAVGALAWAGYIDLGSWPMAVFKAAVTWIGTATVAKRLHDLGRSAWSIGKAALWVIGWSVVLTIVLMVVLGDAGLQEGQTGWWLSVGGTALPVLLLTLWLHCAPGEPHTNRYGVVPSGWGYTRLDEVSGAGVLAAAVTPPSAPPAATH